jgi:hypothetical protein
LNPLELFVACARPQGRPGHKLDSPFDCAALSKWAYKGTDEDYELAQLDKVELPCPSATELKVLEVQ